MEIFSYACAYTQIRIYRIHLLHEIWKIRHFHYNVKSTNYKSDEKVTL